MLVAIRPMLATHPKRRNNTSITIQLAKLHRSHHTLLLGLFLFRVAPNITHSRIRVPPRVSSAHSVSLIELPIL